VLALFNVVLTVGVSKVASQDNSPLLSLSYSARSTLTSCCNLVPLVLLKASQRCAKPASCRKGGLEYLCYAFPFRPSIPVGRYMSCCRMLGGPRILGHCLLSIFNVNMPPGYKNTHRYSLLNREPCNPWALVQGHAATVKGDSTAEPPRGRTERSTQHHTHATENTITRFIYIRCPANYLVPLHLAVGFPTCVAHAARLFGSLASRRLQTAPRRHLVHM
jgi:hypothetical protein